MLHQRPLAIVATRRVVSLVLEVLDLARWAPSGDNSQPWRFEIVADDRVGMHAFDTRRHCVYDLEGHASQLSVGAMLETIASPRGHADRRESSAGPRPPRSRRSSTCASSRRRHRGRRARARRSASAAWCEGP